MYVGIAGVAKKSTPATPYIVGNELVCNGIARALLLPCPPGALMDLNAEPYFFSLDFNLAGQALPPANVQAVVNEQPRLCWGIIAFDVLVLNNDRHNGNFSYDTQTKALQIFDHSHALLAPNGDNGNVSQRLAGNANGLGIGGHSLAPEIDTFDGMKSWTARIAGLPNYLIEGLVEEACTVGFPAANRQEITDFLKSRRDNIEGLITANTASFPKLPAGGP